MKKVIMIIIPIALFIGAIVFLSTDREKLDVTVVKQSDNKQVIQNISTADLAEKLKQDLQSKDVVFIDVREPYEYEEGHIEGMINLPLSSIQTEYKSLSKGAEIVIICRSGNRSMKAAKILKNVGFKNIVNVEGGIMSWQGELVK
jgi:rhodanese-related sulfurtransferase